MHALTKCILCVGKYPLVAAIGWCDFSFTKNEVPRVSQRSDENCRHGSTAQSVWCVWCRPDRN